MTFPLLTLALFLLQQESTFRTIVPVVLVPATVTDRSGVPMDGLRAEDFTVLEDGRPRRIQMDTSDSLAVPLSVVVLVQANNTAPAAILKVRNIGSMIEPLITGARGQAAVVAFGSETKVVQDFTNDPDALTRAFRSIRTQSGITAAMVDAVGEAVKMLAARPSNERRVVLVISENKDRGSKTKLEAVVQAVQREGVIVFPIVFSAYATPFTTKAADLPPTEGGMDLIAAIGELGRLGKADTARILAEYSGARKTRFATLHGLEGIVTSLGEELHSQYLLSYSNQACAPGFHRIEVRLKSHPEAVVRARYGYWTDEESCRAAPR